jgi:pyridoxine 5-phosphate synthase
MVKLGVNIDHIATIRQARMEEDPDPVRAAEACESEGADGITVHLREDRRHIQDKDVHALRKTVKSKLNLEMAASEEIVNIAVKVKPDDICLVPEKRQELTTEGGLDVAGRTEQIKKVVSRLKSAGIKVSIFIDPDERQVKAAKQAGADCVELHTGKYARAFKEKDRDTTKAELERIKKAAGVALKEGLVLNAGHGLDYENVKPIAEIQGMNELNIGFSIIARAAFEGLGAAVREMKKLVSG